MGAHGSKERERDRDGSSTPSCRVRISSLRRGSAKKRADATRANSPLSDGSLNSSASHQPARRQAQQKNGVPDMKTPVVRKPASRRSAPVTTPAKPQPLRDHNRVAGSGAPVKEPAGKLQPQLQTPPAVPTRAQLQQLRHSATGFEAFAVLVQYLVNDLDAFATPHLKVEVEKMRVEVANTKLQLEEAYLIQKKLEEEKTLYQKELIVAEKNHSEKITELVSQHELQISEFEKKIQDQTEQTRCRYEGEISRLERLHSEREAALLEDGVSRLQQAEAEHKRQLRESELRGEELRARLAASEAEEARLQQQVAGLVSGLCQDRDAQLQVTAGRCYDLEEEVRSLRTVLDLRHEELAEVRRQNAELAKDAGELPGALQRIATLQARVEDLQEQLQHKVNFERQLSQENRKLNESYNHVAVQKQRLSQHNEELQWKLKRSTETVHVIKQALCTPLTHNNHKAGRKLIESFNDYSPTFPEISKSYTKLSSGSPLMQRRSEQSNSLLMHHDLEHPSPPESPKVKAVVEKSDSVSWVLDMEETTEAKVSRLVRRAGSFRGSSGLSPPSTAQSQTLPRSRGTSGPGSRRSTGTSAGRSRTRAWSVSSSDNFVSCWGSSGTCVTSAPVAMQRSVSGTPSPVALSLGEDSYTISTGKTPLKRCSGDPDECSVNGDDDDDDDVRLHHNANGSVAKRSNADSGPSSLDGQLLSLRTCGSSSNSSSASPPGSNTCSSTSSCSEAEHNYRHLNGTIIYRQVETETADMRVVPIPHLSASSDLSILAAACAAAKPLMGAPKDAAGEAMISEETLDNENDGDGGDTSSDGEDPQSWENVGLLPSDSEA